MLPTNEVGKGDGYDADEWVTIHCPLCEAFEITKAGQTPRYRCKQCKYTGPFVITHDQWMPR